MILFGFLDLFPGRVAWSPLPIVDHDQSGSEPKGSSLTDGDLKSFVLAAIQVQRISDAYAAKLEAAKSPEEQREVKQAAATEMVKAVENEGISVDKYRKIAEQAQADLDVAERVKQQIAGVH